MQKRNIAMCSVLLSIVVFATVPHLAFAQYTPGGGLALEDELKVAKARIDLVKANPGAGSGTPFLSAGGIITAYIVVALIFGGLFGGFVYMAKNAEKAKLAHG